ncbi:HD domain-containing protein [Bacteroides sp. 214]|uniref:HD domain-containing protein n=1 Tax=Bacteroides sp. 214 TaxID=2302935 RepID=UPI0013CF9100|nr:HD domain-containing protein [Bacteroides sp. 214]NDW11735.1 HD domain-containing protein [Bacteroides sp. 214]
MNPLALINKYYPEGSPVRDILITHSRLVAEKALAIADAHPELQMDKTFIYEAAMLHDIGVFLTNAPDIFCTGTAPYIAHGYLGADLVREEGYPAHALVCERHTGAGLSLQEIISRELPLPHREMTPVSLEEKVICFADKFFSKTHIEKEKSLKKARKSIAKHGEEGLLRFDSWCELFL